MRLFHIGFLLSAAASAIAVMAQDNTVTLIDHIESDGIIDVVAPAKLQQRLRPAERVEESTSEAKQGVTPTRAGGFRVQVFSDNNARTAKAEAQSRARNISTRFPNHRTYVVYNSPFWRLKVGDFRNHHDAQQFADEIKHAFPAYSREVRVVRDRVSIAR